MENDDEEEEKFPWKKLVIVYAVIASDAFVLSVILPFLPEQFDSMFDVRWLDKGAATGIMVASFDFAQFFSTLFLGHLSDIFGRKRMMLFGCLTSGACIFFYGVSTNFYLSLALRVIAGLCNGNLALTRSVCADVTSGKNRAMAFAYFAATWQLSRAVATALGGFLAFRVPLLPFSKFWLPCLAAALFNAGTFLAVLLFLPETLKKPPESGDPASSPSSSIWRQLKLGMTVLLSDSLTMRIMLTYCVTGAGNGAFLLSMLLFYAAPVGAGGLGLSTFENGVVLMIFAFAGALFQVTVYKVINRRMKVHSIFVLGVFMVMIACLLHPVCAIFLRWGVSPLMWIALLGVVSLESAGFTTNAILGAMQSNAAPPDIQGLTMGMGQALRSLFRALGPVVFGTMFGFLAQHGYLFASFLVLTALYSLCLVLLGRLSPEEHHRINHSSTVSAQNVFNNNNQNK